MQVQLHHAGDVSAVYGREDAFGACQPAQLLCRQHDTRNRGDMAKEHYARPRSNGVTEKVQNLCRVLNRLGQRDFLHDDAIALGFQLPGLFAAGMLLIGHEHFVTGLHIDAVRDVAVGLGGIAQQRDLVARTSDKRS